jgi:hypothetical protein
MKWWGCFLAAVIVGCAAGEDLDTQGGGNGKDSGPGTDEDTGAAIEDSDPSGDSSSPADTGATATDTGASGDTTVVVTDTGTSVTDTGTTKVDTGTTTTDTSTGGPITGGPCISGAKGATAIRIKWLGSGSSAYPSYEVSGVPGVKVGAYSSTSPFSYKPVYGDPFLGEGGLVMDTGVFVDLDFSLTGISSVKSATLTLYGRSYATSSNGSFDWNTFDGAGSSGSISNVAPYHWDGTSVLSGVPAGKVHKLRIKPGPPSGSLVVNRIELCIEAT